VIKNLSIGLISLKLIFLKADKRILSRGSVLKSTFKARTKGNSHKFLGNRWMRPIPTKLFH